MKKLETVGAQEEFEHQDSKFLQHCTKKIVINFNCSHCNGSVFSKEFNNYEKGKEYNKFYDDTYLPITNAQLLTEMEIDHACK